MSRVLNLAVLVVYLLLPLPSSAADQDFVLPVSASELKIMSYNVQNLFDAEHDDDKNDFEFLPMNSPLKENCRSQGNFARNCANLDWIDSKVDLKIAQIKRSIAAQGPNPDILVLSEVENPAVVGRLAAALGYPQFRMTNSPDKRGIDCAVLFKTEKLRFIEYKEKTIENPVSATRNLSAAVFRLSDSLGSSVFAILPNHWPSQANRTEARLRVARTLQKLVQGLIEQYKNEEFNYVMAGDFNTINGENPHPIDSILLANSWPGGLMDVRQEALNDHRVLLPPMPLATYYYSADRTWNELDRFFINPTLNDASGLDVDLNSYRIHAPSIVSIDGGRNANHAQVPRRYSHMTSDVEQAGFSDHFAIVMKLKYRH